MLEPILVSPAQAARARRMSAEILRLAASYQRLAGYHLRAAAALAPVGPPASSHPLCSRLVAIHSAKAETYAQVAQQLTRAGA